MNSRSDLGGWLCLSIILPATVIVSGAQPRSALEPITDPEAYAVYDSLTFGRDPFVLLRQEALAERCELRDIVPEEWRSTAESYLRENSRPRSVVPAMFTDRRFTVVTIAQLTRPLGRLPWLHSEWEQFSAAFHNTEGYWSVSAVGFDETHTKAYVSQTHHRGSSGRVAPLEKVDGRWIFSRGNAVQCTISGD
jgi:hypothetical protein